MRPIAPLGSYLKQDSRGFIINEASLEKIRPPWNEALEELKRAYRSNLKERLHSIYVRGSVPLGEAVEEVSDVDTFALIYPDGREFVLWERVSWEDELWENIRERYSRVADIEAATATFDERLREKNPGLAMLIQTQSVCLYGQDISAGLGSFRPGPEMMLDYSRLRPTLYSFREKLKERGLATESECKSVLKRIIRAGFDLVMEREGRYTPALYLCYRSFAKYYPEREAEMRRALELYLNPPVQVEVLSAFVESFGRWLEQEVSRRFENG